MDDDWTGRSPCHKLPNDGSDSYYSTKSTGLILTPMAFLVLGENQDFKVIEGTAIQSFSRTKTALLIHLNQTK